MIRSSCKKEGEYCIMAVFRVQAVMKMTCVALKKGMNMKGTLLLGDRGKEDD